MWNFAWRFSLLCNAAFKYSVGFEREDPADLISIPFAALFDLSRAYSVAKISCIQYWKLHFH